MKTVDTTEYVDVLKELVEAGEQVSMLIAGNSMSPFLVHQRDYIFFEKPARELCKGDPVFYQRDSGQYVMHRICRVNADGTYDIVGDNQTIIEHDIRRDQIFALITQVKRKGKLIGPGDYWWNFFEKIWINIIPFRRAALRAYRVIYRIKKKMSKNKHKNG